MVDFSGGAPVLTSSTSTGSQPNNLILHPVEHLFDVTGGVVGWYRIAFTIPSFEDPTDGLANTESQISIHPGDYAHALPMPDTNFGATTPYGASVLEAKIAVYGAQLELFDHPSSTVAEDPGYVGHTTGVIEHVAGDHTKQVLWPGHEIFRIPIEPDFSDDKTLLSEDFGLFMPLTNYLPNSNDLSLLVLAPGTITSAKTQVGPYSVSNNAWLVTDTGTTPGSSLLGASPNGFGGPSWPGDNSYTTSMFLKKGSSDVVKFSTEFTENPVLLTATSYNVFVDFSGGGTPVVTNQFISGPTSNVQIIHPVTDMGNGWFRVAVSNPLSDVTGHSIFNLRINPGDFTVPASPVAGNVLFYGAQLAEGLFPSNTIGTAPGYIGDTPFNNSLTLFARLS